MLDVIYLKRETREREREREQKEGLLNYTLYPKSRCFYPYSLLGIRSFGIVLEIRIFSNFPARLGTAEKGKEKVGTIRMVRRVN